MHVTKALTERKSTRAFLPTPVSDEEVEALLALATRAPSWSNTQPYRLAYATGARCDAIRTAYGDAIASEPPSPDVPLLFDYPEPLKTRRKVCGGGLYSALSIARDDGDARAEQFRRNYAFFDAPAVVFLFAHTALGAHAALDLGCVLQSLLLAATESGLSTCAQAALASHPSVVRGFFDVNDAYALYCGVALGHADKDAAVNSYQPKRAPIDDVIASAIDSA